MHDQRYQAKHGEQHAGAARDFISDLQRKYRAGEQKEYADPGQANRAYLIAASFGMKVRRMQCRVAGGPHFLNGVCV